MEESVVSFLSFRNPLDIWQTERTFLMLEVLFYVNFILIAFDLFFFKRRNDFRKHLALFFCAVTMGMVTEIVSLYHPSISNFWHSNAMIMLFWGKEPLYMLGPFYFWLVYSPIAMVWSIGISGKHKLLLESVIAGLLCHHMFHALDVVGCKNLWWIWSSSDPLYETRYLGVPAYSSVWSICSTSALTYVLNLLTNTFENRETSKIGFLYYCVVAGSTANVLMVVLMTVLSHVPVFLFDIDAYQSLQWIRFEFIFIILYFLYINEESKLKFDLANLLTVLAKTDTGRGIETIGSDNNGIHDNSNDNGKKDKNSRKKINYRFNGNLMCALLIFLSLSYIVYFENTQTIIRQAEGQSYGGHCSTEGLVNNHGDTLSSTEQQQPFLEKEPIWFGILNRYIYVCDGESEANHSKNNLLWTFNCPESLLKRGTDFASRSISEKRFGDKEYPICGTPNNIDYWEEKAMVEVTWVLLSAVFVSSLKWDDPDKIKIN